MRYENVHDDDDARIVDEAIEWFDSDDPNTHLLGEMLLANGRFVNAGPV